MKLLITTLVITCLFSHGYAGDSTIVYLWPGGVPVQQVPKHPTQVADDHGGNVIRLTDVTNPSQKVCRISKITVAYL